MQQIRQALARGGWENSIMSDRVVSGKEGKEHVTIRSSGVTSDGSASNHVTKSEQLARMW